MTEMQRKFVAATTSTEGLADKRQVLVNCSSDGVDRQGDIVVQSGIDTKSFMKCGGTVLWQHDPDQPIARAISIGVDGGQLRSLVQFPSPGTSAKSDEIYGLIKESVVNSTSIGFRPLKWEPLDPKEAWGGRKYSEVELMEFSFVSVPAMPDASVIARSLAGKSTEGSCKVGASLNLPIGGDEAWDGPAASASIFAHCGFDGDSPDVGFARKGFLVYDSSKPSEKGSYKLPFAKIVDGRLTAMPSGIRAAASRLPQADIPEDCQKKARAVLDHYEAKMKDKGASVPGRKAVSPAKIKGLHDVACLAQLLTNLGYLRENSVREAEREGDNSPLPAMLADALKALADAFLAMSKEEVGELLAGHDVEIDDDDDYVASATAPQVKRFRTAFVKAGRALSAENAAHVQAIVKCFGKAMDCRTKALDSHGYTHDQLVDFAAHLNEGQDHAKALLKSAKKKPDDDAAEDEDDSGEGDEENPDTELSADVAQRKRLIEIAALGAG